VNGSDVQQVASAQTDIAAINSKLQTVDTQLQQVDTRLGQVDTQLQEVDTQVQKVDDQAASLDGRLNHISPFSQFGKDNVIHGPEWLAAQPADNYAVLLASSGSKQGLYEYAQRYNRYLRDSLAYYTMDSTWGQRYVLVYGSFANQSEAAASLWRMPPQLSMQRPTLTRIGDLQK
jgi:septal ring-binding cell division protein DamX